MNLLPAELLHQIAMHLPSSDIPNHRLISKRHASVGADFLFETFLFRSTDATTARTASILATNLKQCVKALDYEGQGATWSLAQKTSHFAHVVEAFFAANAPIDTLGALNLRIEVFGPAVPRFAPACANLARFDVRFECSGAAQTQRSLREFLAGLTQLKHLALGFRGAAAGETVRLRDIVPLECVWARLKDVQVEDVHITEEELSALLGNHARTLQTMYFRNLVMEEGTWEGVMRRLEDMVGLKDAGINEVECDGCARADGEEWLVKKRGGELLVKTNLRRWLVDEGEMLR
jgi:hypothetical protein